MSRDQNGTSKAIDEFIIGAMRRLGERAVGALLTLLVIDFVALYLIGGMVLILGILGILHLIIVFVIMWVCSRVRSLILRNAPQQQAKIEGELRLPVSRVLLHRTRETAGKELSQPQDESRPVVYLGNVNTGMTAVDPRLLSGWWSWVS